MKIISTSTSGGGRSKAVEGCWPRTGRSERPWQAAQRHAIRDCLLLCAIFRYSRHRAPYRMPASEDLPTSSFCREAHDNRRAVGNNRLRCREGGRQGGRRHPHLVVSCPATNVGNCASTSLSAIRWQRWVRVCLHQQGQQIAQAGTHVTGVRIAEKLALDAGHGPWSVRRRWRGLGRLTGRV